MQKETSSSQREERRAHDVNLILNNWPGLAGYLRRVGAKVRNFRSHIIQEMDEDSHYWRDRVRIKVESDGAVNVHVYPKSPDDPIDQSQYEPTEEEEAAIKKESKSFPRSIAGDPKDLPAELIGVDPEEYFVFRDENGELVMMIQWRKLDEEGKPYYLPFSFWSDQVWRMMEPEGLLPLFGLERLKHKIKGKQAPWRPKWFVMVHEGAKCARHANRLVDEKRNHPWIEELSRYTHLGWPGGVNSADRVDWEPIRKMEFDRRIVLVCDNDLAGKNVASTISRLVQHSMLVLKFDDRFHENFDLADEWPRHAEWWNGERYRGPTLEEFLFPATWATAMKRKRRDKKPGKPSYKIVDAFAREWLWIEELDQFINRQQLDRMRRREVFNSRVSSFSDVKDTAALFLELEAPKCDGVAYEPNVMPGVINVGGHRLVNMYRPCDLKPIAGDPAPFEEFMRHLVPHEGDREKTLRWCATLVARPDVRMRYAVLLISKKQGVGKGTLAWILARLVGDHNTSYPTEHMIVDSQFTSWIARKRLAVVHEIYSGQSRKGYDRLKDKITDDKVSVNEKYVPVHTISNWIHICACSNSMRALHLDDTDRRWLVPRVTEEVRDKQYWEGLYAWLRNGGLEITFSHLCRIAAEPDRVVGTGDHAPMTSAKEEVIAESRSMGEQIAHDLGKLVAEMNEKVVLTIYEVCAFVANQRGIAPDDHKLEKPYAIRHALTQAGLRESKMRHGDGAMRHMVKIGSGGFQVKTYVVANFPIEPGTEWPELAPHHKDPVNLWVKKM
jgi:Family of unknown function (DUF5906)